MIVSVAEVKADLNITFDRDDTLIGRKIVGAQNHIEQLLGFKIEEQFPPTDGEPPVSTVPDAIRECVILLAGHWYANREAVLVGVSAEELPFGVWEIVNEFRTWSF